MHLKVALANVWINGDLSGLPLLTEGVTCSFFLYFDITPSVDPVIFEITTCEEFWLCKSHFPGKNGRGLTHSFTITN